MLSTFAVGETASLGIMGAPEVPPLCRETQSLGQQMLKEPLGINGLIEHRISGENMNTRQTNFRIFFNKINSLLQLYFSDWFRPKRVILLVAEWIGKVHLQSTFILIQQDSVINLSVCVKRSQLFFYSFILSLKKIT